MKSLRYILLVCLSLVFLVHCSVSKQSSPGTPSTFSATDSIPWHPLETAGDLDILMERIGDARIVLLGESTHGTREYYDWRTVITKRLISEKGFDLVAVEGDWTDSYKMNRLIKGPLVDSAAIFNSLKQYDRWPSSMWGNQEMIPLFSWLNRENQVRQPDQQISFYGLDLYSFWEWTKEPLPQKDSALDRAIRVVRDFFKAYGDDAHQYARSSIAFKTGNAISVKLWNEVKRVSGSKLPREEESFRLYQQGLLTVTGERYFQTIFHDRVKAINIRDQYMAETITRLLDYQGPSAKAVAWMHNGHAGDAHYSSMGSAGYTSVAEILHNSRPKHSVFSIGFGTYKGKVLAGYNWNAPVQEFTVLPAREGSWEELLHRIDSRNKLILSEEIRHIPVVNSWIPFRSIGAAFTGAAIYSQSVIPRRFDAFIFIDSTTAIRPVQ